MNQRKNLNSLTKEEKQLFINALLKLKKDGRYDEYVHWHHFVMIPSVFPYEPNDPDYRNGAHRGPAFLPWHRAFLMELEKDLQNIDASITIPYWDWSQDASLTDPKKAPIWSDDFMGGDGDEQDHYRVGTGAFAFKNGNWTLMHDGPALTRRFGSMSGIDTLPSKDDLGIALGEAYYDTPNFNSSPFCIGFRNRLEGWVTKRGDYRVTTKGSQLHNRVHLWIGGEWVETDNSGKKQTKNGAMVQMTSPNDPVFFLHHCFIDKIWSIWQQLKMDNFNANGYPKPPYYAPISGGPDGHNLKDVMKPFNVTIESMLDINKLGYEYAENQIETLNFLPAIQKRIKSPFWAE